MIPPGLLLPWLLLAQAAAASGETPPAGRERVFILPVRAGSWVHGDDRRILEQRVAIALGRSRRVRPLVTRDLPAPARAGLPADLSTCTTPECLPRLGRAAGAPHVLALELLEDGAGTLLFATLFEATTGSVLHRRELPRALHPSATRAWADELARWIGRVGDPGRADEEAGQRRHRAPVLHVGLVAGQEARAEAQALRGAFVRRLERRGHPRVSVGPADAAAITHAAWIAVESVSISHRPHFLHRHQTGTLVATVSLYPAGGQTALFSKRASARISRRTGRDLDRGMTGDLVEEVARQWMAALESQGVDRLLSKRGGRP